MKREIPQEVQAFGQLKTKFCQKHNKIIFEVIFGKLLNFVGVLSQCFNSKLNQFFSKIAVIHIAESKSSRPDMFVKKMFSEISQNSQESSFLIKLQAQTWNFIKKETLAQAFSCEFGEISRNTFQNTSDGCFLESIRFRCEVAFF